MHVLRTQGVQVEISTPASTVYTGYFDNVEVQTGKCTLTFSEAPHGQLLTIEHCELTLRSGNKFEHYRLFNAWVCVQHRHMTVLAERADPATSYSVLHEVQMLSDYSDWVI